MGLSLAAVVPVFLLMSIDFLSFLTPLLVLFAVMTMVRALSRRLLHGLCALRHRVLGLLLRVRHQKALRRRFLPLLGHRRLAIRHARGFSVSFLRGAPVFR